MLVDWDCLTEELQIALSREALHRVSAAIAAQAEVLADELECGVLADRGGADALRLFSSVVRMVGEDELAPVGHA